MVFPFIWIWCGVCIYLKNGRRYRDVKKTFEGKPEERKEMED